MRTAHVFRLMVAVPAAAFLLLLSACWLFTGTGTVTGVTVTPASATVAAGRTLQLSDTISPSTATDTKVSWASGNTSVATVDSSGLVTGVAPGTTTITVDTDNGGHTAQATVTVAAGYVYVANEGSDSLSAYAIVSGGTLSPITLSSAGSTTGYGPDVIAISPNGDYLYVTNNYSTGPNGLSAYSIGADGTLTPITLSSAASNTTASPSGIAVSPNGNYLYVAYCSTTSGVNGLAAYSIGTDGTLSRITLSSAASSPGSGPAAIAVSPNGNYLYVANNYSPTGANGLAAYGIGADGTLSRITLSTAGSTTGQYPSAIAISPNGSYLYVTNYMDDTLSAYTIGSDGTLSPITLSSAVATTELFGPDGIAISPNGNYLFLTNWGTVGPSAYAIGSDGTVSSISFSGKGSGTGPFPAAVAVGPNGSYLYVTLNATNSLSAYTIGSDGTLSPITLSSAGSATGSGPRGVAVVSW